MQIQREEFGKAVRRESEKQLSILEQIIECRISDTERKIRWMTTTVKRMQQDRQRMCTDNAQLREQVRILNEQLTKSESRKSHSEPENVKMIQHRLVTGARKDEIANVLNELKSLEIEARQLLIKE